MKTTHINTQWDQGFLVHIHEVPIDEFKKIAKAMRVKTHERRILNNRQFSTLEKKIGNITLTLYSETYESN